MGKYRTFKKPSQIKRAISKAKKKDDKIALSKLGRYKNTKFKKIKEIKLFY